MASKDTTDDTIKALDPKEESKPVAEVEQSSSKKKEDEDYGDDDDDGGDFDMYGC